MLIVLGLGHCDELPSRYEVESSINRTIDEVEKLIRQDPSLPRLSRHEIVDILFNITSKDIETYQKKETVEEARKIYQKALMVVLPYNAEDAKESIKELYTRPPIVKLVTGSSFSQQDLEKWKNEILLQPSPPTTTTTTTTTSTSTSTFPPTSTSTRETPREKQPLENLVVTHAAEKTSLKESSHTKTRYKNHKDTYTEVQVKAPLKETVKYDAAPIKFSFNLENLQKQEKPVTTMKRPVFQTSPTSKDEDVFIVYSTSATTERTTAETNFQDMSRYYQQTTSHPHNHQQNILSSDQWRYNAPPTTAPRIVTTSKVMSTSSERTHEEPFLPTIKISPEDAVTTTTTSEIEHIPKLPKVTFDKTQTTNTERPTTSIYVTPVSSSTSSSYPPSSTSETSKHNSTYNLNSGGFRKITTTTTTMRPEVMDLLASIGLRPGNTTNVEEVFAKNQENLGTKFQIPGANGLLLPGTMATGLTAVVPDSPSIAAQNTFENPISEIGLGMNNLTPDVQVLFQRFGLHTSNPGTHATTTTTTPQPTVNSYTNFKPLPTSKIKDEEMREFLARFGLGVNENRQRKAMPVPTERPSLIEAVPNNMRQILENIGLISRRTPKTTTPKIEELEPPKATQYHVFKPHEVLLKDEGQKMKINELLDTVKLVQEGKASVKDVRKVANDLLATTKSLRDGPDPLSLEEIVKIYNEDVKNEVKRQQSSDGPDQERAFTSTTPATTGIRRFMISVMSTSETWVGRIMNGLERIRRMLSFVG